MQIVFSCEIIIISQRIVLIALPYEPRREKIGLQGFRPGLIENRLEACNFGFQKKMNYTIRVAKTKALISCAGTAKLICAFVFA